MKRALLFLTISGLFMLSVGAQNKLSADTTKTSLLWLGEKVTGQHTGTINYNLVGLTGRITRLLRVNLTSNMASLKEN